MLPKGIDLSEEEILVMETARAFAETEVAPGAAARDDEKRFPAQIMKKASPLGLLGVKVPIEDGGAGASMLSYFLTLEALSEACASTAVTIAVCNLVADCLSRYGTQAQKERWLQPLFTGELTLAAFCLSEPHCGSHASALKATALRDGDHFILNGAKQWITNGRFAEVFLVFVRTDPEQGARGISALIVEKDAPGMVVGPEEKKMGLRSSSTVAITFEDCRVPAENLIGDLGGGYGVALSTLDVGRIGIAAQCVGIGEAALREGVRYASERPAFGKMVADFQASQFAIADSRLELDQAWLLSLRAAAVRDEKGRSAKESSMAKLYASEACGRIVDRMLQLHGGYGYVEDFPIERLYRDARVTRIYEGASEIQRWVIAREVAGAP